MTSLIDVDLERQWTWRCASSYTADARVAQKPNVKLAQKLNVANTTRERASDFSGRLKRVVSLHALIAALVLALSSCSSVSDATLINAGSLLLQHEIGNSYNEELGRYMRGGPDWQGTPSSKGTLEPDRMPDWAKEQYVACVYWEDELRSESTIAQPGPDMIRIRHGSGWGWVLLDNDLNFHILETTLQWTITEDGEEVESFNRTFVDAWDAPDDS